MTIYTRRGDDGETSLADGSRVTQGLGARRGVRRRRRGQQRDRPRPRRVDRPCTRRRCCASPSSGSSTARRLSPHPPFRRPPRTPPHLSRRRRRRSRSAIDRFEVRRAARPQGSSFEGGSEAAARLHLARAITPPSRTPRGDARCRRHPSTSRCSRSSTVCLTLLFGRSCARVRAGIPGPLGPTPVPPIRARSGRQHRHPRPRRGERPSVTDRREVPGPAQHGSRHSTACSSRTPGGVDSTLLAFAAHAVLGDRCTAVLATSDTYPDARGRSRTRAGAHARVPAHRGRDLRARRPALLGERARPLLPLQDRAVRAAPEGRRGRGACARRRRQQRRRPLRPPARTARRRRTRAWSARSPMSASRRPRFAPSPASSRCPTGTSLRWHASHRASPTAKRSPTTASRGSHPRRMR